MQPTKKSPPVGRERAELLAIQSLTFIAEDEGRMRNFLAATGIERSQLRAAAQEDGFLAGLLEHILDNESLLVAFAASAGIDPAEIGRARAALGRGADWERVLP
jgi:hypothetical protein